MDAAGHADRSGSQGDLALGPRWIYPLKAGLTRARSLAWAARGGRATRGGIRILFYHRVSDERDELAVRTRRFLRQMDALVQDGYRAVDVIEVADLLAAGRVDERIVGLSFDDGYRDVAENALPVLAQRGFRATVFVATGVTGGRTTFPWYERQPALLDWDEILELDRGGVLRFEAHTVSHPNLLTLDDEAARSEIAASKDELEQRLSRAVEAFCYPAGLFGERERRLVAEAGFRAATSCEPGLNRPGTDRLALHRIQIDARDRLLDFRAKLNGGHDAPPALRRAWRRARYGGGAGSPRAASSSR